MKYLCYYDTLENEREQRNYALAATNKIDYILDVFSRILPLDKMEVISACTTKSDKFCKAQRRVMQNGIVLKLFCTFGRKNIITKSLDVFLMPAQIFLYLVKNTRKGEDVVVYHAISMIRPVLYAKKIRKFRLILEMEELYSDVTGNKRHKAKEMKICKNADAYIFSTQALDEKLNIEKKPSVIINGSYRVESKKGKKFADEKIHVVYAGTLDPRKGGAIAAVEAARFLSDNYHVHILGFGTKEQIENIKKTISKVYSERGDIVTYEGVLSGEEYISFLQACDIGLSTQNPNASFNMTSFPSKILSYMANGLYVVSAGIEVVKKSAVGHLVEYYEIQESAEIARAIMRVDFNKEYDNRKKIQELDKKFEKELSQLINIG